MPVRVIKRGVDWLDSGPTSWNRDGQEEERSQETIRRTSSIIFLGSLAGVLVILADSQRQSQPRPGWAATQLAAYKQLAKKKELMLAAHIRHCFGPAAKECAYGDESRELALPSTNS